MKLLLFSDLHADAAAARKLVAHARSVDMVVGAGDFAVVRRQLRVCLDVLRAIDRPTVLVAGNNETTDELVEACRDWPQAHVLHGSGVTIGGVEFFGIGGGIPVTPFGAWSYDFTEEQAADLLAPCPAGSVLVSHSPPRVPWTWTPAAAAWAAPPCGRRSCAYTPCLWSVGTFTPARVSRRRSVRQPS